MRSASVFELAVVVVGVVLFLSMAAGAYGDATVSETIDNQTVTVDYTNDSQLNATDVVEYGNATVFNASGAQLVEGTDYTYDQRNGTIDWVNTTATTGGSTATVTFDYVTHQQEARLVATIVEPLSAVMGLLPWLAGVGAVLYYGVRSGGF